MTLSAIGQCHAQRPQRHSSGWSPTHELALSASDRNAEPLSRKGLQGEVGLPFDEVGRLFFFDLL